MYDHMTIAKQIRSGRDKKGYTQEQLGDLIHESKQTISNWERGVSRPSFEALTELENALEIKISRVKRETKMNIKQLNEISEFDEMDKNIENILDSFEIESPFKGSIKKMLRHLLWVLVGYYVYIEGPRWERTAPEYGYLPPEWSDIAVDIRDIIDPTSQIKQVGFVLRYNNPISMRIANKICAIGGELFEDFDEDGFHNGFIQQVARAGETSGYHLLKIIPDSEYETSVITEFRIAALDLAEYLESL